MVDEEHEEAHRTRWGRPRRWALLAVWLGLALVVGLWATGQGLGPEAAVRAFVQRAHESPWGPWLFVGAYVARLALWFSGTALTVAGGFLFGPVQGVLLTICAANLSALVAFGVGRFAGGGGPAGDGRLARWADRLRDQPFETVLIMRLIYLPFDGVSVAAGALGLPAPAFLAATVVGTLPGIVQFVLLGASLEEFRLVGGGVRWSYVGASLVLLALSLFLARWIRDRGHVPVGGEDA